MSEDTSSHASHAKRDTCMVLVTDLSFVATPIIVIAIVFLCNGKLDQIVGISKWAFAATVLSGQAITKFVAGVGSRPGASEPAVAVFVAFVIVLILVPSSVVLSLVLLEQETLQPSSPGLSPILIGLQLSLFVLAVLVYVVFGGFGEWQKREAATSSLTGLSSPPMTAESATTEAVAASND